MTSRNRANPDAARLYALVAGADGLEARHLEAADQDVLLVALPLGVYSGLRTFKGDRFLDLDAHLDRTERSARSLGFSLEPDRPALRRALDHVAREGAPSDSRIRFDVLPEPVEALGTRARIWIVATPLEPVPARFLEDGVALGITRELRRATPLVKTTDFILRRRPFPLGRQAAYEHVMLDTEGRVLEGTSSNFFVVEAGSLRTAGAGVLEGITRAIVLRLASSLEIPVELSASRADQASRWEEAFMTSSSRGIVPVVALGELSVGSGRPGPITRALMQAYADYVEREARPAV